MQRYTVYEVFISGNCSTCFGWYLNPSSGAHVTVITASGTGQTVLATFCYCGGVLQKYNKLYTVASCWTIIDIDSRCTDT